jgi:hypothetical protein
MFIAVIVIIAIVSILLSLWSLRSIYNRKELDEAKKDLKRERVVYHSDDSSSS